MHESLVSHMDIVYHIIRNLKRLLIEDYSSQIMVTYQSSPIQMSIEWAPSQIEDLTPG
jgi:hypothetical protein